MSQVIPQGTLLSEQRTLHIFVGDETNPLTPKTSGVAGENVALSFGGSYAESDNTLETTSVDGWYTLELSDTEVANSPCTGHLALEITGCAPAGKDFQIGPASSMEESLSKEEIAGGVRDDFIDFLKEGVVIPATTGNMTAYDSQGNPQTISVTTSASAEGITATT